MNSRYGTFLGIFIIGTVLLGTLAFVLLAFFGGDTVYKETPMRTGIFGYQNTTVPEPMAPPQAPVRKDVSTFPSATSTWKSRFVNVNASSGKFAAYYFDTTATTTLGSLASKVVNSADAGFVWDYDKGTGKGVVIPNGQSQLIKAENFGAYWISSFSLVAAEKRDLYIAQGSAAHTRVVIDGRIVFEDSNKDGMIPLTLAAGPHTLEVEFESNNPIVRFSVNLSPLHELNTSERALAIDAKAPLRRFFAYATESANLDNSIRVTVDPIKQNGGILVLRLSSQNTVHWDLKAIPPHTISEVTIVSNSGASDAINVPDGTPVFYAEAPDKAPDLNHPDNFPGQIKVQSASAVHLGESASASTDR